MEKNREKWVRFWEKKRKKGKNAEHF